MMTESTKIILMIIGCLLLVGVVFHGWITLVATVPVIYFSFWYMCSDEEKKNE